jgi:hypothetical protein
VKIALRYKYAWGGRGILRGPASAIGVPLPNDTFPFIFIIYRRPRSLDALQVLLLSRRIENLPRAGPWLCAYERDSARKHPDIHVETVNSFFDQQ